MSQSQRLRPCVMYTHLKVVRPERLAVAPCVPPRPAWSRSAPRSSRRPTLTPRSRSPLIAVVKDQLLARHRHCVSPCALPPALPSLRKPSQSEFPLADRRASQTSR